MLVHLEEPLFDCVDDASILRRKISKADLNSLLDHVLSKLEYQSLKHLTPSFAAQSVGTAHVCKRRNLDWATFFIVFYHLFNRLSAKSSMVHLNRGECDRAASQVVGNNRKQIEW